MCDTDGKGKSSTYFALLTIGNDLVALRIRHATLIEIVESGRPVTDLAPYADEDGDWVLRRGDALCWRDTAPAAPTMPDPRDALSRIEASARWLTEDLAGRALGADELRAALARIRDIAREALGTNA